MIHSTCRDVSPDQVEAAGLKELMISSSGFAFDPRTGLTYMVNPIGADVIRWLNEGIGGDRVVDRMQSEYDVDEHTARRDLEGFLFSLRQHALV